VTSSLILCVCIHKKNAFFQFFIFEVTFKFLSIVTDFTKCYYMFRMVIHSFYYINFAQYSSSTERGKIKSPQQISGVANPGLSNNNITKLRGLSPRANYTDRATAACRRSRYKLFRTGGVTWSAPYSRLSRPEPLLFLPSSSSIVLMRLSEPRSRPNTSQKFR
jgi:hypothetical protein